MKRIVIYFSQTGNTEKIVRLIPILPQGGDCDEFYPGLESLGPPAPDREVFIDLQDFDLKINPTNCGYPTCTLCVDHYGFCEQICPRGAME